MKVVWILFALLLPFAGQGQSIEVTKETTRIDGKNSPGYQVRIAAPEDEVRTSLARYLRDKGKMKQSGDYITVAEPLIGGNQYAGTMYATATASGDGGTVAWMGMVSENVDEPGVQRDLEKLARDFGVSFHKEKIQWQIDESLRALQAVEKQHMRLSNQHKDLNTRIENNKRQKIELEKSLENNKLELEELSMKLAANAKAQDSVAVATEQIKKMVDMHRQRQRRVGDQ